MPRIGYAPGAFDLFHIGHLNLLRQAKSECDVMIAGVASDEVLRLQRGVCPVVPLAERLEIVGSNRFVDQVHAAMSIDKMAIWRELRFDVLVKGDDWQGTEMGERLERDFAPLGVEIVYFPYTVTTSSTALRRTLKNIDAIIETECWQTSRIPIGRDCLSTRPIGHVRSKPGRALSPDSPFRFESKTWSVRRAVGPYHSRFRP